MSISHYNVVIIGAGAAGLMCGIEAGRRGRKVLVLNHTSKVGAKILISGGGRCNFTNLKMSPESFVSENAHFCKSALARFTPDDFIKMVKAHGIAYHEKKLGQLFCDTPAKRIVELLITEFREAGAELKLSALIDSIKKEADLFHVSFNRKKITAGSLVIATGGLSFPKEGATGLGYRIAKQFGLKIVPTAPALDGFILPSSLWKNFGGLAGVSIDCKTTCNDVSFRENLLFTHRGLSGPAMLQASLYWRHGDHVTVDLLPDVEIGKWLLGKKREGSKMKIKNLLAALLPDNFARIFTEIYFSHNNVPLFQIPDKTLKSFASQLKNWTIIPKSTVGYQKAEVTRGGVSTDELSSKTMEAKKVSGLYFIGEVVDVTGRLGGYNLHWAWSSGWSAGQYA